jgi:hypothetical protein
MALKNFEQSMFHYGYISICQVVVSALQKVTAEGDLSYLGFINATCPEMTTMKMI